MAEQTWPVSTCAAQVCQAPIVWAKTDKGATTPVDADPTPHGAWKLEDHDGVIRATYVRVGDRQGRTDLHATHWGTCPARDRFRRTNR